MMYFYDEHFMLPLSHDEVVHGKSPMLYKMPGDEWQKFANLRLLYTYMFTHPGAKLLFMGNEFGATAEWDYKSELQWELLKYDSHAGMQHCVQQLNNLYRSQPALYEKQFNSEGFAWVDLDHRSESVIAYRRKGINPENDLLIILNMTPVARHNWQVRIEADKEWKELYSSDAKSFWGTGNIQNQAITTSAGEDGSQYLQLNLPPLAAIVLG